MQRTTISLRPEELDWLAQRARADHLPQAEIVRRALQLYRQRTDSAQTQSFEELARLTSGTLQREDGLLAQQHLREEWSER
jgi:ATP-dependent exoDNAse (exonuclease V) beta subunit